MDAPGSVREIVRLDAQRVSLDEKVAFLSRATSYRPPVRRVRRLETHMSWGFLAGEEVYKLKKPLRFPYLDFSTLARREAACRAELTLNRRLAPNVYQAVMPLLRSSHGLAIGGPGEIVDSVGGMWRLSHPPTPEDALETGGLGTREPDRLVPLPTQIYRHSSAGFVFLAAPPPPC